MFTYMHVYVCRTLISCTRDMARMIVLKYILSFFTGKDYISKNISIRVLPTMSEPTATSTFEVEDILFEIVDDDINEYTQSFVLFATITLEGELKITEICFQKYTQDSNCSEMGSAEIQILDNDRK